MYIEFAVNELKRTEVVIHCAIPDFLLIKENIVPNLSLLFDTAKDNLTELLCINEKVTQSPAHFDRIIKKYPHLGHIKTANGLLKAIEMANVAMNTIFNIKHQFETNGIQLNKAS